MLASEILIYIIGRDNKRDNYSKKPFTGGPREKESLPTRVFVGNLAFRTTWKYLKDYMRKVGDVQHVDIFTDSQGRSKGCG